MQITAQNTNRFLISSFSLNEVIGSAQLANSVGLSQQAILNLLARYSRLSNSRQAFSLLANQLIRVAEHGMVLRNADLLDVASQALLNLPIRQAQKVGQYYQAIYLNRLGRATEARRLLESVIGTLNTPSAYQARALQTLGFIERAQGKVDESLRMCVESLRLAQGQNSTDLLALLHAHWEISVTKSVLGDHQGALTGLQQLSPTVRLVASLYPYYHYSYYNSLAVELGELGRVAEAEASLSVALQFPHLVAYPEWLETREELAAKRQSATPSQIALTRVQAVDTESHQQPKANRKSLSFLHNRLSISKENLILLVTRTATGQIPFRPRILDRLGETLQPRAPPMQFQL